MPLSNLRSTITEAMQQRAQLPQQQPVAAQQPAAPTMPAQQPAIPQQSLPPTRQFPFQQQPQAQQPLVMGGAPLPSSVQYGGAPRQMPGIVQRLRSAAMQQQSPEQQSMQPQQPMQVPQRLQGTLPARLWGMVAQQQQQQPAQQENPFRSLRARIMALRGNRGY